MNHHVTNMSFLCGRNLNSCRISAYEKQADGKRPTNYHAEVPDIFQNPTQGLAALSMTQRK